MVKSKETKTSADYSLQRVAVLASQLAVSYASTRIALDIDNLGYGREEVCACLCALRTAHFSHSERYRPTGPWHDVYRVDWGPQAAAPDSLYVKFRMDGELLARIIHERSSRGRRDAAGTRRADRKTAKA